MRTINTIKGVKRSRVHLVIPQRSPFVESQKKPTAAVVLDMEIGAKLTEKQVYGVPGRDIRFGEKIGDTIKRNIKEEFGCSVAKYKIICVNANYALNNHYIRIGVVAEIDGEPKALIPEDWEKWGCSAGRRRHSNLFQGWMWRWTSPRNHQSSALRGLSNQLQKSSIRQSFPKFSPSPYQSSNRSM